MCPCTPSLGVWRTWQVCPSRYGNSGFVAASCSFQLPRRILWEGAVATGLNRVTEPNGTGTKGKRNSLVLIRYVYEPFKDERAFDEMLQVVCAQQHPGPHSRASMFHASNCSEVPGDKSTRHLTCVSRRRDRRRKSRSLHNINSYWKPYCVRLGRSTGKFFGKRSCSSTVKRAC